MPIASGYSAEMAQLTGNVGGNIQILPPVSLVTGRKRGFVASVALAAQAAGSLIGIARLPAGAVITEVSYETDTSLATATIAVQDVTGALIVAPAATLTPTNTPVRVGTVAALGVANNTTLTDSSTGLQTKSYFDLCLLVGVAALPGAGTLRVVTEYMID